MIQHEKGMATVEHPPRNKYQSCKEEDDENMIPLCPKKDIKKKKKKSDAPGIQL